MIKKVNVGFLAFVFSLAFGVSSAINAEVTTESSKTGTQAQTGKTSNNKKKNSKKTSKKAKKSSKKTTSQKLSKKGTSAKKGTKKKDGKKTSKKSKKETSKKVFNKEKGKKASQKHHAKGSKPASATASTPVIPAIPNTVASDEDSSTSLDGKSGAVVLHGVRPQNTPKIPKLEEAEEDSRTAIIKEEEAALAALESIAQAERLAIQEEGAGKLKTAELSLSETRAMTLKSLKDSYRHIATYIEKHVAGYTGDRADFDRKMDVFFAKVKENPENKYGANVPTTWSNLNKIVGGQSKLERTQKEAMLELFKDVLLGAVQ